MNRELHNRKSSVDLKAVSGTEHCNEVRGNTGRLRILVSAYACEPGRGSEPGIGWNWVQQLAAAHEVWVITRENNAEAIEDAIRSGQVANLHPVYVDLPLWARRWKRGQRGIHLYYHLWQFWAYKAARRLLRQVKFDVALHITLSAYWKPSMVAFLPLPYVWGPVGGGEYCPPGLRTALSPRARVSEFIRSGAQLVGRTDPLVRLTARRASMTLATTHQTEERLRSMGCRVVRTMVQIGLPERELAELACVPERPRSVFRVLSVGRLLHWKGFELALRAFARFRLNWPMSEYWITGDGPELSRLQSVAAELGIENCVQLRGAVTRATALGILGECDLLVHPSFHDSGGWVCIEAMAAGKPVVCLDWGGPSMVVTEQTGIKIRANNPEQVIADLADAFVCLAADPERSRAMGLRGRDRVTADFNWSVKGVECRRVLEKVAKLARGEAQNR